MSRLSIAADTIKQSVSALDVGEAIGLEIRRGRCRCPIHGGGDFNCVLYRGSRGYYCHVCKSGGDVIEFVRRYYSMSFKECMEWFDSTFHLGLNLQTNISLDQQRSAEMALQRRKTMGELKQAEERCRFNMALSAEDIVLKLENIRDERRPRRFSEEWDQDFCTAILALPEARRVADDLMFECMEVKECTR